MKINELITRAAEDFEIPPIVFTTYRRKILNSNEVLSMINEMYELALERTIRVEEMGQEDLSILSSETKNALEAIGIQSNYYTPDQVSPKWILLSRMYDASPWRKKLGDLSQFSNPIQDEILLGLAAKIDLHLALVPGITAKVMTEYRLREIAGRESGNG